ncbi:MAG TPA: hypothetical protein VEP49_21500 [Acidimicrobiia bacterium]|nr:hypothetical protein [Acidimicrobiia bacterium]
MTERDPQEPDAAAEVDETEEISTELEGHPDAPEADVIEQHQPVVPETRPDRHLRADVPEADALEQAIPVDDDDSFDA